MTFNNTEKCAIFDKIEGLYFHQNFGSMSKADLDLLLFSEYIEHCINEGAPYDDYTLSKKLGITQSRVRSLKEKKELKFPHKGFDWKSAFADSIQYAKYDKGDHYVKVIIQDINVMNEIRHYIEQKGWYDECSLNRKLLRIPLDCFTEICIDDACITELFAPEVKKKVKSLSKSEDSSVANFIADFSKEGLKAFLMSASKEILLSVLPTLPFSGIAKVAFEFLETVIKGV